MCLKHPFQGLNIKALVFKICQEEPALVPARCLYSAGLRKLSASLLKKDPRGRPSTTNILRQPLIKDKINCFLSEAQVGTKR
ncbi:unnamed protein product [Discosporangium mesarthrocarpum]